VLGVYAGSFAISIVSGVFPIVNAELYLIGLVVAIGGIPQALALAVLIAAGQMIGKGLLFQTARGAGKLGERTKYAAKLERARARALRWRSKPYSVTFVSATVGLPPLYVVTLLAGILEIRFRMFLLVGFAGRTLRFGTIGLLAALA
jgi:membrane protein YqaA with SNARE-associated domain